MTKKPDILTTNDEPDITQAAFTVTPELQALINSDICSIEDGAVTWREGHLEHVAREFVRDPFATEYHYRNDLAAARQYSAAVWRKLIGVA